MIKIKRILKNTFLYKYFYLFRLQRDLDPEARLLKWLCRPDATSIDVGAANGKYTIFLIKNSKKCIAFEPINIRAVILRDIFKSRVEVFQMGLSSSAGKAMLQIPIVNSVPMRGRATIEGLNLLDGALVEKVEIQVAKLDDFNFSRVGFIKIDVEGHELDVLLGGLQLLKKDKPSILIEAEERHRSGAVKDIRSLLESIGYKGYYLLDEVLYSIDTFNLLEHQSIHNAPAPGKKKSGTYINNFIYVQDSEVLASSIFPMHL